MNPYALRWLTARLLAFAVNVAVAQSWVLINQLGDLPRSVKVAVWISKHETVPPAFHPPDAPSYRSAETSFRRILHHEKTCSNGLNGSVLFLHVGTDPRRTDNLHNRLDELLTALEQRSDRFVGL